MYYKRWFLSFKLYRLKHRWNQWQVATDDDEEFLYDAFVIYSSEDRQWVHGSLREELEDNRGLRLFIYLRDMLAGGALVDRLEEAMAQCRKFVLVLSPNFLASNYCLYDAQVVHHRLMEDDRDVMVVIQIDALPLAGIPGLVTNILNMKECLEWTEDPYGRQLFWDKLEHALKSPPAFPMRR